jgi:beta-D-xylosidase 4
VCVRARCVCVCVQRASSMGLISLLAGVLCRYNWGVEILHGAGIACVGQNCPTILPVLATAASTFNRSAWHAMGAVISTEMRAANNAGGITRPGSTDPVGLNGWGPNINIARDPRWGRELEVPTEDPTLAGVLAAAMTRGIQQGDDLRFVKLLGALKHFTAYSMENSDGMDRQGFSPNISKHDMGDTYLPAYRIGIVEGGALGMMCSYTTVNGTAMCESVEWQQQWAREKLGFQGNIVTDCKALSMGPPSPESKMDAPHNAALALAAGTDLNCGDGFDGKAHGYTAAGDAVKQGLATEAQLDAVVGRSLGLRMRTGMFDPLDDQPYTKIAIHMLGASEHHDLAEEVAAQGLVLLKNPQMISTDSGSSSSSTSTTASRVLPLAKGKKTAVIGPHATAQRQLLGSYFTMACPLPTACPNTHDNSTHNSSNNNVCPHGSANFPCPSDSRFCMLDWSCITSPFQAISHASSSGSGITTTASGCRNGVDCVDTSLFAEAVATAKAADQIVVVLGLSANIETEGRDRTNTTLPGVQEDLALAMLALNKPTVVVLLNGGIVSVDRLAAASANCAIVEAFYPGVRGGEVRVTTGSQSAAVSKRTRLLVAPFLSSVSLLPAQTARFILSTR